VEAPGIHPSDPEVWHGKAIGHVLFVDGHIEIMEYPGRFPMTEAFITALRAVTVPGAADSAWTGARSVKVNPENRVQRLPRLLLSLHRSRRVAAGGAP
jgi:prepilin-type processing-associated H-X9-DG protein